MKTKKIWITKSRLKGERGWTDQLLSLYMPEPDKAVRNPHYRTAHQMCLYDIERVQTIESTDSFKRDFELAKTRKAAAKKASLTKSAKRALEPKPEPFDLRQHLLHRWYIPKKDRRDFYRWVDAVVAAEKERESWTEED